MFGFLFLQYFIAASISAIFSSPSCKGFCIMPFMKMGRQHLYPDGERDGRCGGLELNAFGLFAFDDLECNIAHGSYVDAHCIAVKCKVLHLILRYAVLDRFQMREVRQHVVYPLLTIGYSYYLAFKLAHNTYLCCLCRQARCNLPASFSIYTFQCAGSLRHSLSRGSSSAVM